MVKIRRAQERKKLSSMQIKASLGAYYYVKEPSHRLRGGAEYVPSNVLYALAHPDGSLRK